MNATKVLQAAQRTPLIKFIGKRTVPKSIDHMPTAHPASPNSSLPTSFAHYRSNAQQHGPLGGQNSRLAAGSNFYGAIGGHSGHSLGAVEAPQGTFFDRSELPKRFGRMVWTQAEIEAVETGGASLW